MKHMIFILFVLLTLTACQQPASSNPENSPAEPSPEETPAVQPTQPSEPTVYLPSSFGVYTLDRGRYTKYVKQDKRSKVYNLFELYDAAYEKDSSGKFKTFNVEEPYYGMSYQYPSRFFYNGKPVQFVVVVKHKNINYFDIYYAVKNGDRYDLLCNGISEFEIQVTDFNSNVNDKGTWHKYALSLYPMADVLRALPIETGLSAYQLHQKLTEYCK